MDDPKRLVAEAYDKVADEYFRQFGSSQAKARWGDALIGRLPPHGRVLDLGCGAGRPLAQRLVEAGFEVVGVDGSLRQIELARAAVPGARFDQADMAQVQFPQGGFDGVAAFYALNHLPRDDYPQLLAKIRRWLRPGGVFVANFGVDDEEAWRGKWLGAETFFSSFDTPTTNRLVRAAGLEVESLVVEYDEGEETSFLWIIARAPG